MGAQQSKEELLYEHVNSGNVDAVKALRLQGAGLEWVDKEGKTPLILACSRPNLLNTARVLIELGANVNAYRPGSCCGTPLHHAAMKGFEQMVHLLLSNGANPFIINDDCKTALDLARDKGHINVVRAIESRVGLFCGWLRENYGPGFLEAFAPQLMSRKIWAVVLPRDARNPTRPQKFELAIYPELQAAKPRQVIALWECQIEEPHFNHKDPSVIIVERLTRSRFKFLSAQEGDKQQIQWFYNACRGMPQVNNVIPMPPAGAQMPNASPFNPSVVPAITPAPNPEDVELAMAMNASIQSAIAEGVPNVQPLSSSNTNGWGNSPVNTLNGWGPPDSVKPSKAKSHTKLEGTVTSPYNGWAVAEASSSQSLSKPTTSQNAPQIVAPLPREPPPTVAAPSAPPLSDETFYAGPVQYPSIDSTPVNVSFPTIQGSATQSSVPPGQKEANESGGGGGGNSTSGVCVICLDAPVEGACIPCGHMAGCMSCLKEIEAKKWGCPVCRAKIDQVVRLYAV